MKREFLSLSFTKNFFWLVLHSSAIFSLHDTVKPLKTVPNNCVGISGDFLMGIPDISGHIWKNNMTYTEARKDYWNAPMPDNCFSFLFSSFLDEVKECWGKWTCVHRVSFRLLTCLLLIFPGTMCFHWQLKTIALIPWMIF